MKLTLTKASTRAHGNIKLGAMTRVPQANGSVVYHYARTSKKRRPTDLDYYIIPVDEARCLAISCTCEDYVNWRVKTGETCKHQDAAEAQMLARLRRRR